MEDTRIVSDPPIIIEDNETDPVLMTEDVVSSVVDRLEANGSEEGIDFLVDTDGCLLCSEKMDRASLVREGLSVKELN